jgi:hypothetical protein
LEVFEDGVVRTQLIEVLRNWENGEGVTVLGLKDEMGGFEKRVGMRESDEGDGSEVEGFG